MHGGLGLLTACALWERGAAAGPGPGAPLRAVQPRPHTGPQPAASAAELHEKEARVRGLLRERGLDALLLRKVSSFAWATGGAASYINTAVESGEASLLYTPTERYVVTNNIEAPRLEREEGLLAQGWQPLIHDWFEPDQALRHKTQGLRLGADVPGAGAVDLSAEVARLRAHLLPAEGQRFRALGRLCAQAMSAAIAKVQPGQTEHLIAAHLAQELIARGVWPVVDLVATDERVRLLRHPLPTAKVLSRYAMLVLCGRKWGLVCSMTRLVHFGPLPDDLLRRQQAVAQVDAAFLAATRPGARLDVVLGRAVARYAETGFPQEWRLHHQGGAAGYEPREYLGTPVSRDLVAAGQVFAWNPSITGVKSEDSVLVGERACEVLTEVPGWPLITVPVDGQTVQRPAILEVS